MSVIPTSLVTDGVLNAEGCSLINCPAMDGTAASASALSLPLNNLSGTPGTSYNIGSSLRARVVMQAGHAAIDIVGTSANIGASTTMLIQPIAVSVDATAQYFFVDKTQAGSAHTLTINANGNATSNVTLDIILFNN